MTMFNHDFVPEDEADPFEAKDCYAERETDKALFVRFWNPESGEEVRDWIPKSQIHDDSEVYNATNARAGTLVVTNWIARKKDWTE